MEHFVLPCGMDIEALMLLMHSTVFHNTGYACTHTDTQRKYRKLSQVLMSASGDVPLELVD